MPDAPLRVAYFPDSFHEVNGVAHTSRHYEAFARRTGLPFLCVRAGLRTQKHLVNGNIETLELARGPLSFALEKDLRFDIGFIRHIPAILRALRSFQPTVIHITGPSDIGILGAILAHSLGIPLVASWHTNVHEYAARRTHWLQRLLPHSWRRPLARKVEHSTLLLAASFYRAAQLLFAPNQQLCTLLQRTTKRPCELMQRGVDAELFSPLHRTIPTHQDFVLGYVGRLSIEKNVTLLIHIGRELIAHGIINFRFLIIGHGAEEASLREHLPHAEFRGVLHGEPLASSYAEMDLFVFPSHTDTFGNVVLEALASGVPALVTNEGGPCTIVRDGLTGFIRNGSAFTPAILHAMHHPSEHEAMREQARLYAVTASWDAVFTKVCTAYLSLRQPSLTYSGAPLHPSQGRSELQP